MPKILTIIQFAWRLNGFLIFFISYICAVNIIELSNKIKDKKNILCISSIIVISVSAWFGVSRYIEKYEYEKETKYEQNLIKREKIGPYNINRDYLPVKAVQDIKYIEERENRTYIIKGEAKIKHEEKKSLTDNIDIEVIKKSTLELPYIYYHGYTAKLNNKIIKTYQSEKGFLCVDLEESGILEVKYTGTIIEKIGYIFTGVTFVVIIIYVSFKKYTNKMVE